MLNTFTLTLMRIYQSLFLNLKNKGKFLTKFKHPFNELKDKNTLFKCSLPISLKGYTLRNKKLPLFN